MRVVRLLLWPRRAVWLMPLLLILLSLTSACAASHGAQQLRITNSGSEDLKALSVLFPGPTADSEAVRVHFGDVPAGTTTGYESVPGGVYRYAAYEYNLDARHVDQPVVDWVGEKPMDGTQFTYEIRLDLQRPTGGQIQLVEVSVDRP